MATVDELLELLLSAAREGRQADFDQLEHQLMQHYPGGFAAMPPNVYARYLEIDRAWPTTPGGSEDPGGGERTRALGPRTLVTARLPDQVLGWLLEFGARVGRNRSDVLTACVLAIREDPALEERVVARLRPR